MPERPDLSDVDVPVRRRRRTTPTPSRSARPGTRTRAGTATRPCRRSRRRWPSSKGTEAAFGFARGWRRSTRCSRRSRSAGDRVVVEQRAVRRRLLDRHEAPAAVRGRPSTSSTRTTSTPCARRCPAPSLFYVETIANPNVHGGGPRGAGRCVPGGRRARGGRQHLRVAVPVHPGRVRVRLRACTPPRSTSAATTI